MGAPNPFFAMQERVRDLLRAHAYFAGLTDEQILTEKIANLEYQVENALLPLGFGVVITTAAGKAANADYELLDSDEDLNVSITHNPTTDEKHDALDGIWAAIQALKGQSVYALGANLGAPRPGDFFRITGHQKRLDGPPGCHVHELYVAGRLRL